MDFEKMIEALFPPPSPLRFSERDGLVNYGGNNVLPVGELVVDFANLIMDNRQDQLNMVSLIVSVHDAFRDAQNAGEKASFTTIYSIARKFGSHAFAYSICLLCYKAYCNGSKSFTDFFGDELKDLCLWCRRFVRGKKFRTVTDISLDASIRTDENGKLQIVYSTTSAIAVVSFHLFKAQELGLRPNICKVCGRAFFPISKSNELYCRKKYADGRTCADVAFDSYSKNDPFYSVYRKAYKTMFARAARMEGNGGKIKFKKWQEAAELKLEEYKASNDYAGFEKWIADSKK